jgi:hypothetical protein
MNWLVLKKISAIVVILHFIVVCPLFASKQINYDTAWTYVYDGGMKMEGYGPTDDILYNVKEYAPGSFVAVGLSGDTANAQQSLLLKFDNTGKITLNKMYATNDFMNTFFNAQELHSVIIAKNGDFLVGGKRFIGPLVMRLDQGGNIKWATWYYDSLQGISGKRIDCDGSVNSIR